MALQLHILPRGLIALERHATPQHVVVIDGSAADPGTPLATVMARSAVEGIDDPEPDAYANVHAIAGITHFGEDERYLLAVTGRELACQIQEHDIWRITGGLVVPLFEPKALKQEQNGSLRTEYIEFCTDLLQSGHLYYSESYDLTRSLQHQSTDSTSGPSHAFTFNLAASHDLSSDPALAPFAINIMAGFIGTFPLDLNGATYTVALISRYSRERLGTRYTRRGLDNQGHAANFVEMEQLVWLQAAPERISSFVQIRGSVPTVWKQSLDLNWKPKMTIADQGREDVQQATKLHFESLERSYLGQDPSKGTIVCVDLLNASGFEKPLTDTYRDLVSRLGDPRVQYEPFWVNKYCKRMNYGPLAILLERLHSRVLENGFFVGHGKLSRGALQPEALQQGVIRTSCLDSLDRTNMVCTMLAKDTLLYQLASLGMSSSSGTKFDSLNSPPEWVVSANEASLFPMNNLYADAGDAISLIYSGTGHMKSDVVRTGKRQWILGSWADGRNSLSRYYLNNFRDGVKQDLLDLWNGNVSAQELLDEESRDQLLRSAEEPPSLADADGVGVLRLPSLSDVWIKAKTYSSATGVSSFVALVVLFSKWISPRRVDSIVEFAVGLVVSAVFFLMVKVLGVDRRLIVSEPKIKKDRRMSEPPDVGGQGKKKK